MSDGWTVHHGDSRDVVAGMDAESVHSVVTDPPYALTSVVKRFGNAQPGSEPFAMQKSIPGYMSRGFMGQKWDTGEIAHDPAFWIEVLRVLKPGGHLLAFGGTRTYHRLACAVEDAGFEIRDQIGWLYGQGFPKSHNQHDEWEGWGTALKPAWEPIVMARKPLVGTVAKNLEAHGCGAINIDGCRVGHGGAEDTRRNAVGGDNGLVGTGTFKIRERRAEDQPERSGRWPANVIHDGSDEVLAAFPDSKGQQGDVRGTEPSRTGNENTNCYGEYGRVGFGKRSDTGSAARFFYCAKARKADRDDGCDDLPAVHRSNGNKWTDQDYRVASGERPPSAESGPRKNVHPTVKPTELMRYLCRLVTPPGGTVLDPFMGSGSTGRGAVLEGFKFIGIEIGDTYFAIAERRIAAAAQQGVLL